MWRNRLFYEHVVCAPTPTMCTSIMFAHLCISLLCLHLPCRQPQGLPLLCVTPQFVH